jgi:hypothetical protein
LIHKLEPRGHAVPAALKFLAAASIAAHDWTWIAKGRNCAGNVAAPVL